MNGAGRKEFPRQADGTIESLPDRPPGMADDPRIVYGMGCTYWGGIESVKILWSGGFPLPCCPHCHGMLFELGTEGEYREGAQKYAEQQEDPGYPAFVEWLKGRECRNAFPIQGQGSAWAKLRVEYEAERSQNMS